MNAIQQQLHRKTTVYILYFYSSRKYLCNSLDYIHCTARFRSKMQQSFSLHIKQLLAFCRLQLQPFVFCE